ncbi:MAG: DUF72 domain-containing protein [Crenarchaeota archaeon]|nr:DUF72 domain-containing protein [Thermoproteota archaeon]
MTNYLVGTGGWAYFCVPGKNSLESYSKIFNFVEVNFTFYEYPKEKMVENWRQKVPEDFTFSIRCHQDLTHRIGFRPVDEAYEVLYKMIDYCNLLKTPYLVLETPASYILNSVTAKQAQEFFSSVNLKKLRLVWELRAPLTNHAVDVMQKFNIISCVDLSKQPINTQTDVVYSRLFGKGKHNLYQFTDEELIEIDNRASEIEPKTVILSFHGARMHSDAARFKGYALTGKFMQATNTVGIESAKTVLQDDAKFPVSKWHLIEQQGWKVVDLTENQRVHFSQLLQDIPNKTYKDINEVVQALEASEYGRK